jgi:hypothetical protein
VKFLTLGFFAPQNWRHPFVRSAFTELLIQLRDLMAKSEKFTSRINFDEDVVRTKKIKDVTDLVRVVRDAVCHPESNFHFLEPKNIYATFTIEYGKGRAMTINGVTLGSDYEDDVAFWFGQYRIYLHRHIERALNDAHEKLSSLPVEKSTADLT